MPITITPLTPHFAAEVTGVDIGAGLDEATFAEVQAAFEDHSVLVFRDQRMDPDSQIAFSERFGPLEEGAVGVGGAGTKIVLISNVDDEGRIMPPTAQRALFSKANQLWHTDSSFKRVPALASVLAAHEIPAEGGETEFASMRVAWDRLPEAERRALEGRVAVHSIVASRDRVAPGAVTEEQRRAMPPVEQAMVRINPSNGRRNYFVASHVERVLDMEEDEGRALVDRLIEFATGPGFTYLHHWRPGDVVMWDNRCILHRGRPYRAESERRILHRTTISCPGPTAEAGRPIEGTI